MKRLFTAGIIGLLAGCQTDAAEAPLPISATFDRPGVAWYLIEQSDSPAGTLLFAPRASDDIAITLSCSRKSGTVEIETHNPGADGTLLYLASGNVARTVVATRLPEDEFYGDAVVSRVELSISHPVAAAFRKSGSLAKGLPPIQMRVATTEEMRAIERFFGICEG